VLLDGFGHLGEIRALKLLFPRCGGWL
jgi:hypothetical protein